MHPHSPDLGPDQRKPNRKECLSLGRQSQKGLYLKTHGQPVTKRALPIGSDASSVEKLRLATNIWVPVREIPERDGVLMGGTL